MMGAGKPTNKSRKLSMRVLRRALRKSRLEKARIKYSKPRSRPGHLPDALKKAVLA